MLSGRCGSGSVQVTHRSTPWRRIGINRAAVEPLVDAWVADLRQAAFATGPQRIAIADACDRRLNARLEAICDEHGIHGELQAELFRVVDEIKDARAAEAMGLIREAVLSPRVVVVQQRRGGCLPVMLGLVGLVLLLVA